MPASDPRFRSLHALRIKGFAKADVVAEIAGLPHPEVETHLGEFQARELAAFREARSLWQLTPAGKVVHREELDKDATPVVRASIERTYPTFLELNGEFKLLCGDWQLLDGDPGRLNDHTDVGYDGRILDRLIAFDAASRSVVATIGSAHDRMAPYAPRLGGSLARLKAGETKMFTGVMCNSYHDVWMELHEDLILTLGIDRSTEGSF